MTKLGKILKQYDKLCSKFSRRSLKTLAHELTLREELFMLVLGENRRTQ